MAKPATATAPSTRKAPGDRVAPVLTEIRNRDAVPMPTVQNKRGSTTSYPFDKLEVGQSFGVNNKTVKQLSSIISNQNRKPGPPKRDATGAIVYKMIEVRDANGVVTGHMASKEAETDDDKKKHFFAAEVDPKTDPDKVKVRVWRDK
jgi:hypothetical protein